MSVVTKQEEGQPNEVEELVRSLDHIPEASDELRSKVLRAAADASRSAKRQKGWAIAAGFAAMCAACVLMIAFLGGDDSRSSSSGLRCPVAEGLDAPLAPGDRSLLEESGKGKVISGGVF